MEAIPTSAQSRCLPATYDRLPGSSPTSTVPSPGVIPRSASAATRSRSSALIVAARALPSRICAVMSIAPMSADQWRKCRAPVKYMVMPALVAAAITSSSRIDPPGCTRARTPASNKIVGPSSHGKKASEAATAPPARSPARCTANRQESTRLTWPIPIPTAAPSDASRMAFDFTPRTAPRKLQVGEYLCATGLPRHQSPVGRLIMILIDGVGTLHQQATVNPPGLGTTGRVRLHRQNAQVLLHREHLDGPFVVTRGHDDLGEHLGHLPGHLNADRTVCGDHSPVGRHRIAGVCSAMRLGDVTTDGDSTRVGVLDDRHRRGGEVIGRAPGRVRIDIVVVRHLLAVQLIRGG